MYLMTYLSRPMQTIDFNYSLPEELIAKYPLQRRSESRLLSLNSMIDVIQDGIFGELPQLLNSNDLLVFNNTQVIPARLYGVKESGGRVEVLVERVLGTRKIKAMLRASKSPQPGTLLRLEGVIDVEVLGRIDEFYELEFKGPASALELLQQYGHMPLPPYIDRLDDANDQSRYQTVYASVPGAVAAPTAGLHFDSELIGQLESLGVASTQLTLHVGAGTFSPVRVQNLSKHRMHSEYIHVPVAVCEAVSECRKQGGRVIAVGTTSARALEAASESGDLAPFEGETNIFITPGYQFRVVDAMITNFHLPESTLLMLVCALGGYERVMQAYRHAVEHRYRFYSYGDAMFINCVSKAMEIQSD